MNDTNSKYISPVIICGMHRSGTSLLSEILSKMDVFMGAYQDNNKESIYFQRLNRWMLSCIGSSWDKPKSFNNINNEIIENKLASILRSRINNIPYFGIKKVLQNKSFSNINYNWGWKDPSNTFTISIWRKIFPKSKIIYMLRHPLDVSISLLSRNDSLKKQDLENNKLSIFSKYVSLLSIVKGGISSSLLINNIDDCLRLYNEYYNEIISYNKNQNILFVKYEDLLLNNQKTLNEIAEFICVDFDVKPNNIFSSFIDKSRAYSFRNKSINYSTKYLNRSIYNE